MPNDVKPLLSRTVNNTDDCIEGEYNDKMPVSHLASFHIVEGQLTPTFIKGNDPHKRNVDKEHIKYKFENMTSLEDGVLIKAIEKKKRSFKQIKTNDLSLIVQALPSQIWIGLILKTEMVKGPTELNKLPLLLHISKFPQKLLSFIQKLSARNRDS